MDTRMRGWRASGGRLPLIEPCWLAERTFRQDDLPAVRRFAKAFGAGAGLGSARLTDWVLAASEAAACATAWGPCITRVRLWMTGRHVFCEVRGDVMTRRRATRGTAWHSAARLHGTRGTARHRTATHGAAGRGTARRGTARPDGLRGEEAALRRAVLRQVSDYVTVASGPDGAWVLLSMSVAGS
jgi:hypothetical protein